MSGPVLEWESEDRDEPSAWFLAQVGSFRLISRSWHRECGLRWAWEIGLPNRYGGLSYILARSERVDDLCATLESAQLAAEQAAREAGIAVPPHAPVPPIRSCIVCSADLLPPTTPPHCQDCVVTDEHMDEWEAHIAAGIAVNDRWIPVGERLPEPESDVLGWTRHGRVYACYLADTRWWTRADTCLNDITHWRPLPPPPSATRDPLERSGGAS